MSVLAFAATFLILGVACGVGGFFLGSVRAPTDVDSDSETVHCWRDIERMVAELTRRNAVGLCSVRDRLDGLAASVAEACVSRVEDRVRGLLANNEHLQQQVKVLQADLRESLDEAGIPLPGTAADARRISRSNDGGARARGEPSPALTASLERFGQLGREGASLDDMLGFAYDEFRAYLPYNRFGIAEIDEASGLVRTRWQRCDRPTVLKAGYVAPLAGSSLELVLKRRRPLVIGDLRGHAVRRPESKSTRLLVEEGFCSSLTCPVTAGGRCRGFLFFISDQLDTYSKRHAETGQRIADEIGRALGQLRDEPVPVTFVPFKQSIRVPIDHRAKPARFHDLDR